MDEQKWIKQCPFLALSILDILTILAKNGPSKQSLTMLNSKCHFKSLFNVLMICFFDILSLVKLLSGLYLLSFTLENNCLKNIVFNNTLRFKKKNSKPHQSSATHYNWYTLGRLPMDVILSLQDKRGWYTLLHQASTVVQAYRMDVNLSLYPLRLFSLCEHFFFSLIIYSSFFFL